MRILSVVVMAALVAVGAAVAVESAAPEKAAVVVAPDPASEVGTSAQVFGKITSMHTVNIVGMADPHVVVKLESAPGDVEIVDLGSSMALKNNGVEPHLGQQFWVDGQVGKINGKPLVVAETISESKLVTIDRQPLSEETTKHAAARQADASAGNEAKDVKRSDEPKTETASANPQVQTIEGTVVHTRHVKIEGDAAEHILAKLQTDNGIAVVDLGTTPPNNVDLAAGKPIAASGIVGHLNGKPIILAESVGNLIDIQRPNEPECISTSASPTAK